VIGVRVWGFAGRAGVFRRSVNPGKACCCSSLGSDLRLGAFG
jgi:hypothetical protein